MKKIVTFKKRIILTISILLLITFICINISFSHSEICYKKITISSGDTIWGLARYEKNNNIYFENNDIRDIVDIIKQVNNLENCNINIGDELIIPTI